MPRPITRIAQWISPPQMIDAVFIGISVDIARKACETSPRKQVQRRIVRIQHVPQFMRQVEGPAHIVIARPHVVEAHRAADGVGDIATPLAIAIESDPVE